MSDEIAILNRYRAYSPPVDVVTPIRQLLRYVPENQLAGIKSIVLTNSTSSRRLRRNKTWSRGRKVAMNECAGFYCGDHIELLIDNVFKGAPNWAIRWPFTRTILLGMVLYHEIGHHIHCTQRPERREKEDVADAWGMKLIRDYFRRRYWYLRPIEWGSRFVREHWSPLWLAAALISALAFVLIVMGRIALHRPIDWWSGIRLTVLTFLFVISLKFYYLARNDNRKVIRSSTS